jgi:hypothetical protein
LALAVISLAGLCTVIGQATEEPAKTQVTAPPESLKLDQFYKKYISAKGPAHSQLRQSP